MTTTPTPDDTQALAEADRAILLNPCVCGHTLNDHGSLAGCWACGDDESAEECLVSCEALIAARVARIVADKVTAARAESDALRARIEALHQPDPSGEWCDHCWTGPDSHGNGPSPGWPCATIRALTFGDQS